MDSLFLTDKSVTPTEEIIADLLGKKYVFWQKLISGIKELYPESELIWQNYRDAKCWLLPLHYKKKNLCWISIANDAPRVSFWFGKKVEPVFEKSAISESLKERFSVAETNKMGRGFSIFLENVKDLEDIFELIDFKSKIK